VESLPVVSGAGSFQQQEPQYAPPPPPPPPIAIAAQSGGSSLEPHTQQEILSALERLGDLHQKGILTDSEFQSKKAELLSRL
jgi:hypothetical protein